MAQDDPVTVAVMSQAERRSTGRFERTVRNPIGCLKQAGPAIRAKVLAVTLFRVELQGSSFFLKD